MVHVEGDLIINRPVDVVFDFVADERNEPLYNRNMRRAEQLTPGPIGPGTRFEAETTSIGRIVLMVIEVTQFDRPNRLGSTTHLAAMDIHGVLTFSPVADGTRMHWSWEIEPRGVLRHVPALVAWMGRRQERAIWNGLKSYLEQLPAGA